MDTSPSFFSIHKKEILAWSVIVVIAAALGVALALTQTTNQPNDGFAAWKANLIKNSTTISGIIMSISSNSTQANSSGTLTIKTSLFDITNPQFRTAYDRSRLSSLGGGRPLGTLPRKQEVLKISFNSATQFTTKPLTALRAGDTLTVTLTHSVYDTQSPLVAKDITYVNPIQQAIHAETRAALGNTHELFGTVTALKHTSAGVVLSVRAKVVDQTKLAATLKTNVATSSYSYTVPYIEKPYTVTVPSSATSTGISAVTVGSFVRIDTVEDIYSTRHLTAHSLAILTP